MFMLFECSKPSCDNAVYASQGKEDRWKTRARQRGWDTDAKLCPDHKAS